ncbi:lysophospholipid acyltransferase family protein [Asticcacaulis machinosus]|uniref:Lysophospholipid acyltransferase family protein n=1 Tax=Asticcacaulis machinosus TaxID=2984211 RepID=A0ABT5HFP9_9CAUL|nr:lysophospholipid acyltransferase family protein [Asticcacaulis machinosus]MDC7674843.1 lysophospholipid acyltransferase family protein [Asticcacaulis machinosus]
MAVKKYSFFQDLSWRIEAIFYDLFVAVIRALPIDTASDLGGWMLRTMGPLTNVQNTVQRNIDIAFPDKDKAWKKRVITEQWDNLGRTFAEFPIMDKIRIANGRVEVIGGERLEALAHASSPVVFISGHLANWEIMPSTIVDFNVTCLMTYRAANNPYVDKRIKAGRFRYGVRLFAPKGGDGAKDLLLAMNKGESVALMNDQKFNKGVPTPFFDSIVYTAPGPTRLAMRFGTVLQPMSVERTHKARFRVIVHPPITVDDTGNRSADIETTVCKVSKFVEDCVIKRPEEWFWAHKRWPKESYKRSQ